MNGDILKFYSRKDIQKEIVEAAKNREIAVRYADKGFGKRPDILQFEADVLELAKNGATSFHCSEERWKDPLQLKPGMTIRELDNLRTGWDLVLDIDSKFLEYSKICANLLIEALRFHSVRYFGIKFSGSSGFHICIPFESFPSEVNNTPTKLLFPEAPRLIASYLKDMIKKPLAEEILKLSTLKEITQSTGKQNKELIKANDFDPYSVLDIDTVLISNRHMFRTPYSFNEKTWLISIPIKAEQISNFKLSQAKPENVTTDIKFFDPEKITQPEASQLIMQAFDWQEKKEKFVIKKEREYKIPKTAVKEEFFPPCMSLALKGMKHDGRKRAVFILTNFLKQMGYPIDKIQEILLKWNKKNYKPLREGYIQNQISWHKKQNKNILPPNCDNKAYYISIGLCKKEYWCKDIKNPVNYTTKKLRVLRENKSRRKNHN